MDKKMMGLFAAITLAVLIWGISAMSVSNDSQEAQTEENIEATTAALKDNNTESEITSMEQTNTKTYASAPAIQIDTNKTYTASMETSKGTMKFNLFASETPNTVNSFVFLSRDNFYDGVKFHRIMKDFMIQGGDPLGTGTGGPGYSFDDEPVIREYNKGILAMANSGPNTNGSQFFVMTVDYPLPKDYIIFGELVEGEDVLDTIAATPVTASQTGEMSSPTEDVTISGITIVEE